MVMYVKEFLKNKNKQNKIQIQGKTEPKRWLLLFLVESTVDELIHHKSYNLIVVY